MNNLPYFFLLLKKNIALWTILASGSFSQIDTLHTQYERFSPHAVMLRNYSISKGNTFKDIWITSTAWETSISFTTSHSKYMDSAKYYFGTNTNGNSIKSEYTL